MKKKILLFKIGAIGDTLMTTPFLRQLRKNNPHAEIDYLIGKSGKDVLLGNKNLDAVIPFDESIIFKKKIGQYISLASKIKKKKYDIVYVLDKHWALNITSKFFDIRKRIGFDRAGKEGMLLTDKVFYGNDKHETYYYLDLLKVESIKPDYSDTKMDLNLSASDIDKAESVWKKYSLKNKRVICIIPGGGSNPGESTGVRNWPIYRYISLIERLMAKKYHIVLIGGKSDEKLSQIILGNIKGKNITDLTGKLKLKESASVISRCDYVICNDSGPMHLAACVNDNIISIFGPTNPKRKAPLLKESHALWKGKREYEPEYELYGKLPGKRAIDSIKKITVEDVLKYIK
jgi:lipopolysaccharide heptosyltransferase II